MYPELMLIPMREELTHAGIKETRRAEEVDAVHSAPSEGDPYKPIQATDSNEKKI